MIDVHIGECAPTLIEERHQFHRFTLLGRKVMSPASVVDPLAVFLIEQAKEKEDALFSRKKRVALKVKENVTVGWFRQVRVAMTPAWIVAGLKVSKGNRCRLILALRMLQRSLFVDAFKALCRQG